MRAGRKANGEGTVFQLSENKWVAKIYLGTGPNGEWQVKQFSGKTEAIVKKKLKEYKHSPEFKERHIPANETVATYFTKWLSDYQYNKLMPSSYDRLESKVMNHIIPAIGHLKIEKVTRDRIQDLINLLYKTKKLSYSSIKKVYVALNSCFGHALINDCLLKNPCLGVSLPSPHESTKKITPFTPSEIECIKAELSKVKSDGKRRYIFAPAFLLLLNTGMRMGEALSLCWADIDLINKRISINKNSTLINKRDENGTKIGGYKLQINITKTSNGNRPIPINKSAEEALVSLKEDNDTEYVIINSKKHPVLHSNFERSFHKILNNAGINGNHGVHTLRHTFAEMTNEKGIGRIQPP